MNRDLGGSAGSGSAVGGLGPLKIWSATALGAILLVFATDTLEILGYNKALVAN